MVEAGMYVLLASAALLFVSIGVALFIDGAKGWLEWSVLVMALLLWLGVLLMFVLSVEYFWGQV